MLCKEYWSVHTLCNELGHCKFVLNDMVHVFILVPTFLQRN